MNGTESASLLTDARTAEIPVVACLIGGHWIPGESSGKETVSPIDGAVVGRVPYASTGQVDRAVAAAKLAQADWKRLSVRARADLLYDAVDAVEARGEELSRWVTVEMGKTLAEARAEVYAATVDMARASIEDARRLSGSIPPGWGANVHRRVNVIHEPIGVAGIISPWNFPVDMLANIVGALMMGNTCVWKPSEWAPYAPQLAVEALISSGLPNGVINLVHGAGQVGERLVSHNDVGMVAFIGSTAVGEQIARAAGVKKQLLELGGNGPLVILEDADVNAAVDAAVRGSYFQAGQVCVASERILVHEAVHDQFVTSLVARARALKVGNPLDPATEMGPLSDQRVMDTVIRHVADARNRGAQVMTGGTYTDLYYEPTVLTGVTPDMEIAREATFGPVAPIMKVSSAAEALTIANDSPYGLSMGVFTSSLQTAFEMANGLEAGSVQVNGGTADVEASGPFGGYKKSGVGRVLGSWGLTEFTRVKTISLRWDTSARRSAELDTPPDHPES